MKALVCGAGIGGLTAALSLHAAGIEVEVVESVSRLLPLGVGINLQPHAVRELIELGLGPTLAGLAVEPVESAHFDRYGNAIWSQPRGRAAGYRWPAYSVHRGELQAALAAEVRARVGEAAVRTGATLRAFDQDSSSVHAVLADRAGTPAFEVTADILVGADGVHSTVRRLLHPGEGAPLWNGVRMWRGVVETEPFLTGRTIAVAGTNSRAKFVAYPISRAAADRGRALVNWVAEVRFHDEHRARAPADWNRTGDLADVLPHFADWRFGWLDIPALMRKTSRILEYPMVDRDPLPWWSDRRVTLLGDAAHPMYPIGSNGGSQAIVDARVLAYELSRTSDPVAALAAYEAARREPTSAIVLACREMPGDKILSRVAERAPGGFSRIEDVLSAAEMAALTDAYARTTNADAESLNTRPSLSPGGSGRAGRPGAAV